MCVYDILMRKWYDDDDDVWLCKCVCVNTIYNTILMQYTIQCVMYYLFSILMALLMYSINVYY